MFWKKLKTKILKLTNNEIFLSVSKIITTFLKVVLIIGISYYIFLSFVYSRQWDFFIKKIIDSFSVALFWLLIIGGIGLTVWLVFRGIVGYLLGDVGIKKNETEEE